MGHAERFDYAEYAIIRSASLVQVPAAIETRLAAAAMLQGIETAHYLAVSAFPLSAGHTALVHAAAGGTGEAPYPDRAPARRARHWQASTEEKAELARTAGASDVIIYTSADFEAEARRLTNGRGVDVVYDSVGQATFEKSLAASRPRHDGALRPIQRSRSSL